MKIVTKLLNLIAITLTLTFTTLYAESANAHEEHGHKDHDHAHKGEHNASCAHKHPKNPFKNEVSKETIEKAAIEEIQSLVSQKKIHKSWIGVPISKIGKTHYGDTDDWVVGFDNMKIKNKKRRTLYIFVSIGGEIRGANYTGN